MIASVADKVDPKLGYGWLRDRVAKGMADLRPIKPAQRSIAEAEDAYLKPICRTFEQCIKPTLHSALDHLELVAETLNHRPEPHPYAESTLIRTAITGASTALWILAPDDTETHRRRGLEFTFRDYDNYLEYLTRARNDGLVTPEGQEPVDKAISGIPVDRLEWIVERVNELSPQDGGRITVKAFRGRPHKTNDTSIVQAAAAALDPAPPGGFDAARNLVVAWKYLSGFAHGLSWPAVGNWEVHEQDEETGKLTVSAKADPDTLLNTGFAALIVVEKAISRWRELCARAP